MNSMATGLRVSVWSALNVQVKAIINRNICVSIILRHCAAQHLHHDARQIYITNNVLPAVIILSSAPSISGAK